MAKLVGPIYHPEKPLKLKCEDSKPPEKLVSLQPVGQKLQLERVGLAASRQVVVELREEIILSFQVLFTWGMKLLMK